MEDVTDRDGGLLVARSEAIDGFARVTERLAGLRDAGEALASELAAFADLSARDEASRLDALSEAVGSLGSALDRWRGIIADPAAKRAVRAAASAVEAASGDGRRIGVIAAMTDVVRTAYGASSLEAFVLALRSMADELKSGATELSRSLRRVADSLEQQRRRLTEARAALDLAEEALAAQENDAAAAAQEAGDRARRGGAAQAEAMAGETRGAMVKLIGCMQFADAFAQRSEHLLAALEGRAPARRLAEAQRAALSTDSAASRRDMVATLDRLDMVARRAWDFVATDGAAGARAAIESERASLAAALAAGARIEKAASAAAEASATGAETVRAALDRFAALKAIAKEVRLSAINAVLLSARTGKAREPLSVLAEAVRESALEVEEAIVACDASMTILEQTCDQGLIDDVSAAMARLQGASADCRASLDAAEARSEGLATARARIDAAAFRLDAARKAAEGAFAEALAAIAPYDAPLADAAGPDAPEARSVAWASYTMERERAVHRELYPEDAEGASSEGDAGEMEFF